ncbi:MAG: peptide chain release factor-like protein [Desulfobacteraceae bacterium]|nr:peptide chain release factor-like protein [Desulfobacteraceae bacterium]
MGPKKEKIIELENRMEILGIDKNDIEEKFIKSSGRGGQKVNKSSSAVFLKHIPTQLTVKYGKARSQHLNRFLALRLLIDKIEEIKFGKSSKETDKINKIRKQKKKRKKRARQKNN